MKTSNKLLLGFLGSIICLMIFVSLQLKAEYKKINFRDKFRNYDHVALKTVKFLEVRGSSLIKGENVNEFFINCLPGQEQALILPREEYFREHLNYRQAGDTLIISSKLPHSYGLNIYLRGVTPEKIKADAALISLQKLHINHLQATLTKTARLEILHTNIKDLKADINNQASINFSQSAVVNDLDLILREKSNASLKATGINKLALKMSPSASINATKENLILVHKSGALE